MENKIGNTTQRQTEQIEGSRMWEKTQKKKKNGGGRVEEKKEENKGSLDQGYQGGRSIINRD